MSEENAPSTEAPPVAAWEGYRLARIQRNDSESIVKDITFDQYNEIAAALGASVISFEE